MRNREKLKKFVCLLMSVGMVLNGNTFTGYSTQAETMDEITLMEDSAPVSAQEEIGEAISSEEAENVSDDFLPGEEDGLFIEDLGNDLPDADVMDDILFVDETVTDPAAGSIEDVNDFESDEDYGYIEYSDEFEELESITEAGDIEEEEIATEGFDEEAELFEEQGEEIFLAAAEAPEANGGEIVDGASFAGALGNGTQWIYNAGDDVYEIELNTDIRLKDALHINAGHFIIKGSGIICRTDEYTGSILKIERDTSVILSGNVVLDGGAVWEKDGEDATPAQGASNTGVTAIAPMVNNNGTFILSGNAVIQNHDGGGEYNTNGAIYSEGTVIIEGGSICRCGGYFGVAAFCHGGNFTMTGGEIYGNSAVSGSEGGVIGRVYSDRNMIFSGGSIHDNAASVIVNSTFGVIEVTGGTYSGNTGYVFRTGANSTGVYISGGTFAGNAGAAKAFSNKSISLSGNPLFTTGTDIIEGPVTVTGSIETTDILLKPADFELGTQALYGDAELIAGNYEKFILTGSEDSELIINREGRIDTSVTSLITDGDLFVEALGGSEYAVCSEENGVYTVTLKKDISRSRQIFINSGQYQLEGTGMISRADGYNGTLVKVENGASLTISGNVVLNGGAVWKKDGEDATPAQGASNTGVTAIAPMVNNNGTFILSGNAVIQNHDGGGEYNTNGAIYSEGTVIIEGGSICRCGGYFGVAAFCHGGNFTMTGGEIYGNSAVSGSEGGVIGRVYSDRNMIFSGGSIHDNAAPVIVNSTFGAIEVTGGTYSGNTGYVFRTGANSTGVYISGGTFVGNAGAAKAFSNKSISLSGNPLFTTGTDIIEGPVTVTGSIETTDILLKPADFELGTQALYGDAELIAGNYEKFILTGSEDSELIINREGRIDTSVTSLITDGDLFVEALGGSEYAVCSEENGVYTVTLKKDISRSRQIFINSGQYQLEGTGMISRADGYNGTLVKVENGASLTISGNVVLNGGAVWKKDGEDATPAQGASNTGVTAIAPMVNNNGTFILSGNAVIQNHDGGGEYNTNGAIYSEGTVIIEGGSICRCGGYFGVAAFCHGGNFTMTGGEIYGNSAVSGSEGGVIGRVYSDRNMIFSGGSIHDNAASVIVNSTFGVIEVTGGTYSGNTGYVFRTGANSTGVYISGGTFAGNAGAAKAFSNKSISLSGNPLFMTETDIIEGPVVISGKLSTETGICIVPESYASGTVVANGTDTYILQETDFEKIDLHGATESANLHFDQSNNRIVLTYMLPVLIEAAANANITYDGEPVACGEDFQVSIYLSDDGEKGEEITSGYTVGGGELSVRFQYRKADDTDPVLAAGLPMEAGSFVIYVSTSADNQQSISAGSASFDLVIQPKVVDFNIQKIDDVYYSGTAYMPEPAVLIDEDVLAEKEKDYTLTYEENIHPGTYTVTAIGIGNYAGSTGSTTFDILEVPILVETRAETGIIYDGSVVKEGEDFHVQAYLYMDGAQGDEITQDYTGTDGAPAFTYQYRGSEAADTEYADGLPRDPGSYVIRVTAEEDTINYRASASKEFSLTIDQGPTVIWKNGNSVLETDENHPYDAVPSYDGTEPARAGTEQYSYTFAGWATEDGQETGTPAEELPAVTGDITYYAAFTQSINQYTVTFTDGFGNTLKTYAVEYGNAATAPEAPACSGYTFEGWDADYAHVTGDLTVTATWGKVTAEVSFDANGGSGTMDPLSMTTEDPVPECDFTAPKGKKFKEWNEKADGSGKIYQPGDGIYAAPDMILYAQWENTVSPEPVKVSIANAAVSLSAVSFTYNGKAQRPIIKTIDGKALKEGTDYTASWSNASSMNAGTYTVTITGKGNYSGTTKAAYQIKKAANSLKVKAKTATVRFSKLKKKAQTIAVKKVMTISGAKGKVTYKLVSVTKKKFKKYFKINAKTGKVTVKKKLKKGTYKIKVKVTAAGNANYKSLTRTVTFKIKVK